MDYRHELKSFGQAIPLWIDHPGVLKLKEFILPKDNFQYDEATRFDLKPGKDRYVVKPGKPLADTHYSKVYEGYDMKTDRKVAIKMMNNDSLFDINSRREAVSMAKLENPGVVNIYDFFYHPIPKEYRPSRENTDKAVPIIIMEFIDDPTLAEILSVSSDGLDSKEVVSITSQVADTIDFMARRHNMIHRDIKPGNIFLTSPRVKISDFGFATATPYKNDSGWTEGSPFYISPEACNEEPVTQISEVFSLAAVSYEMLAGMHPFPFTDESMSPFAYITGMLETSPYQLIQIEDLKGKYDEDTLSNLDAVFLKALAKNPEDRYRTATEFANALKACFPKEDSKKEDA